MLLVLALIHITLSLGDINAIIPIIIIIILIAAAAGLTRGFDIFSLFGLGTLAGIGLGSRGSVAKRGAYDKSKIDEYNLASGTNKDVKDAALTGGTHKGLDYKKLNYLQRFRKQGAILGGEHPDKSSPVAGAYHTYRTFTGRTIIDKGTAEGFLYGGSASTLTKNSEQQKIKWHQMPKEYQTRDLNREVANRVRMAILNESPNTKPRQNVPEQPFSGFRIPGSRVIEEKSLKGLAFSTADNAAAWALAEHKFSRGRSDFAQRLRSKEMRDLAKNNPQAFNRKFGSMLNMELYRHIREESQKKHNGNLSQIYKQYLMKDDSKPLEDDSKQLEFSAALSHPLKKKPIFGYEYKGEKAKGEEKLKKDRPEKGPEEPMEKEADERRKAKSRESMAEEERKADEKRRKGSHTDAK